MNLKELRYRLEWQVTWLERALIDARDMLDDINRQIADAEHCVQTDQKGQNLDHQENTSERMDEACPVDHTYYEMFLSYLFCPYCGKRLHPIVIADESAPAPSGG